MLHRISPCTRPTSTFLTLPARLFRASHLFSLYTPQNATGNAAKAGLKKGDTIIYASSFFGDELWPTDKLGFTNSAISAAPSPVTFIYVKGANEKINVKRLPKRPAPPRFGRKLTAGQLALATHICVDCGWIYCEK